MQGGGPAAVVVIALAVGVACAYQQGDPVHASRRSKHKQWMTKWTDLSPGQLPRFGEDSVVALRASFSSQEFSTSEPFRAMLSFADERFSTPWVLLWDGKGYVTEDVKIRFVYSGNDVESVHVETRGGSKRSPGTRPAHVLVHYLWEESVEKDSRSALRLMYAIGAGLVVVSSVVIMSDVTVPLVSDPGARAKAA